MNRLILLWLVLWGCLSGQSAWASSIPQELLEEAEHSQSVAPSFAADKMLFPPVGHSSQVLDLGASQQTGIGKNQVNFSLFLPVAITCLPVVFSPIYAHQEWRIAQCFADFRFLQHPPTSYYRLFRNWRK